MAKSIRDHRVFFVFNLAIVFIVGVIGNMLTLLAFPYALVYYKSSFPMVLNFTIIIPTTISINTFAITSAIHGNITDKVTSSITVLILHLALCDLLYCIVGLPNQMSIYTNGYLKYE